MKSACCADQRQKQEKKRKSHAIRTTHLEDQTRGVAYVCMYVGCGWSHVICPRDQGSANQRQPLLLRGLVGLGLGPTCLVGWFRRLQQQQQGGGVVITIFISPEKLHTWYQIQQRQSPASKKGGIHVCMCCTTKRGDELTRTLLSSAFAWFFVQLSMGKDHARRRGPSVHSPLR